MNFIYKIIFIIAVFPCLSYAESIIFYKYADGESYSMYNSTDKEAIENPTVRDAIIKRLKYAGFSLKRISDKFYKINTVTNIAFFGDLLTQYDISPLSGDRFRHILWVSSYGKLVKTEVYDLDNRLVFAFSNIDFNQQDNVSTEEKWLKPFSKTPFYKGFYHIFTKKMPEDILHIVFADGLNKFSVFINPKPVETGTVYKIIYGNYLLSKVVSGIEYTIVGSVPYDFMENVIKLIVTYKTSICNAVEKGQPITEDIIKQNEKIN